MTNSTLFNEVWTRGHYREGSTCLRLIPFLKQFIPPGAEINDYGSGTGRADVSLVKDGYKVNMVDFADLALEDEAKRMLGPNLTYQVSPLESLPTDFPFAEWGICINVLMTVDPLKLDAIMQEMRRTCKNLIIEAYDVSDMRLGRDMTTVKGDAAFWFAEMSKYWSVVESYPSPEHKRRYITIGRS